MSNNANNLNNFYKCQKDIVFFARNYINVNTQNGHELIKLFKFQESALKRFITKERFFSFKKNRDVGMTTLNMIYILWQAMFFDSKHIALISENQQRSKHNRRILLEMLDGMPEFLKQKLNRNNSNVMEFSNYSTINFTSKKSLNSIRGSSINSLIIDDIIDNDAFYDELANNILPIMASKGGKIVIACEKKHINFQKFIKLDVLSNGAYFKKDRTLLTYSNKIRRKIKIIGEL